MTDKVPELNDKYKYKPLTETKTIYVNPENRITSEVMTKFEYCQVISIRAKQLEDFDNPFTDVGDISDPIEIAKKEVMDKVRTTNGQTTIAEKWQVNEMAIPYD